eukprot:2820894-Pyramimonas_sp.AAC.1
MIAFALGLLYQPLAVAHGDIASIAYTTTTSTATPSFTSLTSTSRRPGHAGGVPGHFGEQELDRDGAIPIAGAILDDDLPALLESFVPAPEETALPTAERRQALVDRIEAWARVWIPSLL